MAALARRAGVIGARGKPGQLPDVIAGLRGLSYPAGDCAGHKRLRAPRVSLEAIFLSTFVMIVEVMIGQNRGVSFQQTKANHDFVEQETELKTNT